MNNDIEAACKRIARVRYDTGDGAHPADHAAIRQQFWADIDALLDEIQRLQDVAEHPCCLDNTHTDHWSDGYTQTCKTHGCKRTTDTGYNR